MFDEFKWKCERADNNRGVYKTKNNLRNHCLACDNFYHWCLGYFMIYLYDPQPEKIVCFQELLEEKEVEAD